MTGSPLDPATDRSSVTRAPSAIAEWLLALSFANLLYLKTWDAILDTTANVIPAAYFVAIANVLALSVVFWGAYVVLWKNGNRWVRGCSLLVLGALVLTPFHAIASIFFSGEVARRNVVYTAALATAAAFVASHRVRVAGWHVIRFLVPVVVITFGQSLWRAAAYDAAHWTPPEPVSVQGVSTPRLIWIIFDEWDFGLTFDPRPSWLRTPELDRLNSVSFHASRAVSPGLETDISIPRLLTGQMATRRNQIRNVSTIFSTAKAEGFSAAVAAWYIDYCRVFSESLDACWSTVSYAERNSMGREPAEIAVNQVKYLFESTYRSPFGQSFGTKRHILDYGFVTRAALHAVTNPAFDFLFIHFPIPHPPLFYDRTTGRFDLHDTPLVSVRRRDATRYLDALELVDRTVARVREALESANLWERTHLIISSDHPARNRQRIRPGSLDPRVPFIVRVAGASNEIAYDVPLNTVVSSALAMALLRGEIQSTAQVRTFIEGRAAANAGSSAVVETAAIKRETKGIR